MDVVQQFLQKLGRQERKTMLSLNSPLEIQAYLDSIPYSAENANRCPLRVLQDGQAHCLDGALLAAAALRRLGYPPVVVDLLPDDGRDDDHVLAIFRRNGGLGALAKSNFVGLRYREPIYRNLRELVMSYFEDYFNLHAEKTLRAYTYPIDLSTLDKTGWMWSDAGADAVEKRLWKARPRPLMSEAMIAELAAVDKRAYDAGFLGTDWSGLYNPTSPPA